MPQMSSMDATFRAAQDLIYSLYNRETTSPIVKLGDGNKETLRNISEIFLKANPPALPPRVPVREVFQKKL